MRAAHRIAGMATIGWLASCAPLPAAAPPAGDLAGGWQLFVDDYLIAESRHLERVYHPFEKHPANPLPGIRKYGGRGTVLPALDGPGYRLWSSGGKGLYTSADGLVWQPSDQRPARLPGSQGCCSVIATPWEQDPARRFKMVTKSYDERSRPDPLSKGGGWYGWQSPDGIHWTAAKNAPLFFDRSDVGKFCWDPRRQQYFGTPKIGTEVRGHLRRCVGFSASPEFDAPWPTARLVLVPDQLDDRWCTQPGQHTEFYGLSAFAYQTMVIGLLEVFRVTDGVNDGPIQIELVTSRDGLHWQRTPGRRAPILALGAAGQWDAGMIKTPNQPFVEGDSIKLFYGASNQTHGFGRSYHATRGQAHLRKGGTGLATLRKDGFASLDAGSQTGTVTTRPLAAAQGPLAVNYRAGPGGWLKVEVLDAAGQPVRGYSADDCRPLEGDCVNQTVAWRGGDELPSAGQALRLRFLLQKASLFSFHASDAARCERALPPLAVLHGFEGKAPDDMLPGDGRQAIYLAGSLAVDRHPQNAAFGTASVAFAAAGDRQRPTFEIDNTFRLGRRFTLAAMVKPAAEGRMRLFSTWEPYPTRVGEPPYERSGPVGRQELIFDFDTSAEATAKTAADCPNSSQSAEKNGTVPFSPGGSETARGAPATPGRLRLVVQGQEVTAPAVIAQGRYHHLAATYDDGAVRLYLDGRPIGEGRVPAGEVAMLTNLRVGDDCGPLTSRSSGPRTNQQLIGNVDDILVLGQVLSRGEVRRLNELGAARSLASD